MRSRASRSSACQVSASNCTRLPGIALGRPFVMVVKKLRQLLAQAFVPLRLVAPHHRLLEQALLTLLRQLAPQIEGGEAEGLDEAFDALVFGHVSDHDSDNGLIVSSVSTATHRNLPADPSRLGTGARVGNFQPRCLSASGWVTSEVSWARSSV